MKNNNYPKAGEALLSSQDGTIKWGALKAYKYEIIKSCNPFCRCGIVNAYTMPEAVLQITEYVPDATIIKIKIEEIRDHAMLR